MGTYLNGNAVFYFPEFPYSGEIETSCLLHAIESWQHLENIGAISPIRQTVVITPNKRIASHSDLLNDFVIRKLEDSGVSIMFSSKMISIDKGNISLIFY